jgi:hypothetical protein
MCTECCSCCVRCYATTIAVVAVAAVCCAAVGPNRMSLRRGTSGTVVGVQTAVSVSHFIFGTKHSIITRSTTCFFCFPSHLLSSPFYQYSSSLPINSSNSDPGSLSRLFSPLPTTVRAFSFYRAEGSAFPLLVDLHRILPIHALALSAWSILQEKVTWWIQDSNPQNRR